MSCMSDNKKTIERYMDGFNKSDHAQILSFLTEDVVWEMPVFEMRGGKISKLIGYIAQAK